MRDLLKTLVKNISRKTRCRNAECEKKYIYFLENKAFDQTPNFHSPSIVS